MKQYGIETLHEHQSSLEQKARFTGFPVLSEIFLPRSDRSWRADVLKTPRVSMAIDSKMYRPSRSAYFSSLQEAASSAAAPDSRAAALMYDSANGQVTVTSQHSALPLDQGTSVSPSGHLPSDLNRPEGSLVTGKPAEEKARAIRSLRA